MLSTNKIPFKWSISCAKACASKSFPTIFTFFPSSFKASTTTSLGLITLNAFTASNSVLIPVQCEYYALEGLGQLLNTVELVRKHMNKDFKVEGALLTMYDARTNLSNQVVKEVKRYFEDKVYKNVIPRNVKLSEAPSYGMPITLYDPRSKGAKSYEKFTREFLKINEEEQKAAKHMKKGE